MTNVLGNGRCSTIAPQRTLLPGTPKADEAALIDRANLTIRLIEKPGLLTKRRTSTLSTHVFGCTQALPEKEKFKAVCETAVAAVQKAYPEPEALDDVPPFDGGTETAVACWCATRRWTTPSRWRMCARASKNSTRWPPRPLTRRWPRPA